MTFPLRARLLGAVLASAIPALAFAQDHTGHDPEPAASPSEPETGDIDYTAMRMLSPLGPYEMTRDGSGTSWQPDESPHSGVMTTSGDWMVMGHVTLNLVHSSQSGPRGGDKTFFAGMIMGMAQRPLGAGTLGLRAMLSPDPFMGKSGYPLLLAAGETADGVNPIIDRQHPHDLFMELSASYSLPVGDSGASVFVYGGLPGEPAFGPPAFMHRQAAMDSPEAPISHHWLDSTHITFGVVTAGVTFGKVRVESSVFHGREPDEERYDIETGALDSWSGRISWNPTPNWSLQASAARINSPEQLEPDVDQDRLSASALYSAHFGDTGTIAATFAWGRKRADGESTDAWVAEAAAMPDDRWTVFGRAERIDANELLGHHGGTFTVSKLSVGAIRDFRLSDSVKLGFGGLVSVYDIPQPLAAAYDGPVGGMAFIRLKIG